MARVGLELSPQAKNVAVTASIVCTLQAAIWLVMSILGLIGHGSNCDSWFSNSSQFLKSVQQIYYQNHSCPDNPIDLKSWSDEIMDFTAVLAWMIVMLIANSIWLLASPLLIVGWSNPKMPLALPLTSFWCVATTIVCVVDVVACAMFGADYGVINYSENTSEFLAPSAVIMTLSARGFILWVVNFGLLVYFISYLPTINRHVKTLREAERMQHHMNHLYGPPVGSDGFENKGFMPDQARQTRNFDYHSPPHNMSHQNSHSRPEPAPKPVAYSSPQHSATAALTAGYPRYVAGQHIPRPDYSPPLDVRRNHAPEPVLRSAMKHKY